MSEIKITECRCCGNRESNQFVKTADGYLCKCCGVSFRYETEEEKISCMMGYRQLKNYRFEEARETFIDVLYDYPESIDARWGLLLARYGIVFVKGFFDNIIEPIYCFPEYDELEGRTFCGEVEYKEIMSLVGSDIKMRYFYESRGREIDRAIKKFRECKKSTECDVFICVKISAATEKNPEAKGRTEDYEYALRVYNDLKKRGVKAFFSFITLENEVNSDDLIWVNLVKSKKMLLIGSRRDYLESAWVKSEWKRWLFLERDKDMHICVLKHDHESPKSVLPRELYEKGPQIYTLDTYDKMLDNICGEDERAKAAAAAKAAEEAKAAAAKAAEEAKAVAAAKAKAALNDGKVIFADGSEEIIPYGTQTLNPDKYSDRDDVTEVIFPKGTIKLPLGLFMNCPNLKKATIPEGVTEIEAFAFQDTELEEIVLPKSLKQLGGNAFDGCRSLKRVVLPEGLENISTSLFSFCDSLKRVTIPSTVKEIKGGAFQQCSALTAVTIPATVTRIETYAFDGCTALKDVYYGGTEEQWKNISINSKNEPLKNAKITYFGVSEKPAPEQAKKTAQKQTRRKSTTASTEKKQDAEELYKLGTKYFDSGDYGNAVLNHSKAAEMGHMLSQRSLAYCYQKGYGVPQNYAKAFEWYMKSAEQGNAVAQGDVGYFYENGFYVAQNYTTAAEWYTKAANQGNAWSQRQLGYCYQIGNGVPQDYAKAFEWYMKSAEQGNAVAQGDVAFFYEKGFAVARNYTTAAEWYTKAANQGNAWSQGQLGYCYQMGNGVPQNYVKAAEWYTKAANQGNAWSQRQLGYCYQIGNGVPQNYAKAFEWYTKSAELGNAVAQGDVGYFYENGYGVAKNYTKAAEWYTKAANQGNAWSQRQLGYCYQMGNGVPRDYEKSFEWYMKSAEQGNAVAQGDVAYSYENGLGVTKNDTRAFEWYTKAAEQGNAWSQNQLGECYYFGKGVRENYKKAFEWYSKSAAQGNTDAQYSLGYCYENGKGTSKNKTKAAEWYRKSADRGNNNAIEALKKL